MRTTLSATLLLALCATTAFAAEPSSPDPALMEQPFLYEVVRHLYRWYMDEVDIENLAQNGEVVFWVRELKPELDPNDRSRYGEILLPARDIHVKVKKADYEIEELGLTVRHEGYKIINVGRRRIPDEKADGFFEVRAELGDLRDYCFRTRNRLEFPSEALGKRLRESLRAKLREDAEVHREPLPSGEEIVHVSSLSPVANELWVFWETGRLLIRFSADVDLRDADLWDHQELAVDLYDIDEQVVVSLDEVAGSNAYMTRDQVGRVLFNCVVLGRRLVIEPSRVEPE